MSDCADNFGTEKSAPEEKATTVNPDIGTEVASKSPETKFDSSVSDHVIILSLSLLELIFHLHWIFSLTCMLNPILSFWFACYSFPP